MTQLKDNHAISNKFFGADVLCLPKKGIITSVSTISECFRTLYEDRFYSYKKRYDLLLAKNNQSFFIKIPAGPSAIIDCVYLLSQYYRVDELILIGLCGSLDPAIKIGDTILPNFIFKQERVSDSLNAFPFYAPACKDMALLSIKQLEKIHPKYGKIATISHLAEEAKLIDHLKYLGLQCIDLECSAFYLVTKAHQIRNLSVFVVSDFPEKNSVFELGKLPADTEKGISQIISLFNSI